jgi:hypothetical protein
LWRSAGVCLVLGAGIALADLSAKAQPAAASTAADAGSTTAQPPQSSDLDADFWALVRDSTDPGALQSYLQSFPNGKFAPQARDKLARLQGQEDNTARRSPAPSNEAPIRTPDMEMARTPDSAMPMPSAANNKDLARALQQELKRVGCLDVEADGVWGDKSRTALKDFVRHAKLNIPGDEPNVAVLDAASARRGRVCPLVCDNGEKMVGDRCVPAAVNKPRRPSQERAQEPRRERAHERAATPRRTWAERPSASRGDSPNSGKRLCFGAARNELVTCQ